MKTFQKLLNRSAWRPIACLSMVAAFAITVMSPASALAKGYATDDGQLQPGMVAALSEDGTADKPKVERASIDDDSKIIGVTTTPDSELVTIASGEEQVYVQTTGEVNAFVSDLSGEVKKGDLLTLSPLRGVLMKADANTSSTILGIALEGFSGKTTETKSIQDSNGQRDVKVATLRINIDYKAPTGQGGTLTDSSLRRLGVAVTGRDVGEIRVMAAVIIFLIVLVAEGGIIYGAVSSAITALGRNPMARKIILREMMRVILIAAGVLVLGVAAIYAILWI
jgi:hypothetical protein